MKKRSFSFTIGHSSALCSMLLFCLPTAGSPSAMQHFLHLWLRDESMLQCESRQNGVMLSLHSLKWLQSPPPLCFLSFSFLKRNPCERVAKQMPGQCRVDGWSILLSRCGEIPPCPKPGAQEPSSQNSTLSVRYLLGPGTKILPCPYAEINRCTQKPFQLLHRHWERGE